MHLYFHACLTSKACAKQVQGSIDGKHWHEKCLLFSFALNVSALGQCKSNLVSRAHFTSNDAVSGQFHFFFLLSAERVLIQSNDQKFSQSNDLYPVPPLPRTKFPTGQRDGQPWNENGFVTYFAPVTFWAVNP